VKTPPAKNALLEIGTEEIPARFMPPTLVQITTSAEKAFADAGIAHEGIQAWGTPRRITIFIKNVSPKSTDRSDVKEGPPPKVARDAAGNWTPAAQGFAKKEGVAVDKLTLTQTPKGERYCVTHQVKGQKTEAVLKELFPALIRSLTFPKSMIWESVDFRFARPVRWFVSLYNGNVVRFKLNGLVADRTTVGLLSLGGQKISIPKPEKYKQLLQSRCILVDPEDRRQNIRTQIDAISKRIKAQAIVSDEHLDEVVHLTEYPSSILGHFPEAYLQLPKEVLVTVLKKHQKFFPIESGKGQLTNSFIGVRNGPSDSQDDVRDGYERVINARFSDAQFFFEKDLETRLDVQVEKLAGVGFHAKLGSMLDKTHRVVKLTATLAEALGLDGNVTKNAARAALLAKADLVTQMVGELPELQGVAGRFYGERQESAEVAHAIEQHYWPITSESKLPESVEAALVAVADKIDTLAANFSVGLIPSGSADPYGLRRAAVGVIRILSDRRWNISISQLIDAAFSHLASGEAKGKKELSDFFNQRFSGWFGSQGFRADEIDAVLTSNGVSVSQLGDKLRALKSVRGMPEFASIAIAIKRARNVITQAKEKGLLPENPSIDLSEIKGDVEKTLLDAVSSIRPAFASDVESGQYLGAIMRLPNLAEPIDAFFAGVMVMDPDEELRSQRLRVLMQVKQLFDALADFSKLQVSGPTAG